MGVDMVTIDIKKSEPGALRKRDDLSPKSRGAFLRASGDFQTELFRVVAGFIPAIPRWELRREVSGLVFRDARRVQELRNRCRELGAAPAAKHLSRGVVGRELIEAICEAPDAGAAFRVIYGIVKPQLRILLEDYLRDDLRVFDAPSIPVVESNIEALDHQIAWSSKQPEIHSQAPQKWIERIGGLTTLLGEALRGNSTVAAEPVRSGRKIGRLPILRSVIPDGFQEKAACLPSGDAQEYRDRELFHAHNFLMEFQAADSCASLLFEAPDMPWEFYFDSARHMWDETRHCEFGELKLKALGKDIREMGLSNTAYVLRQTIDPLDRYAALTTQEADAFPGKHAGLKDAIDNGDDVSARAWSYDISDETQHVRYGHKWIPVMIEETGEPRSYEQIKRDAMNWRRDVLAAQYSTAAQIFENKDKPMAGQVR
jgi:hypothetical protein